jgi:hypothetical protein
VFPPFPKHPPALPTTIINTHIHSFQNDFIHLTRSSVSHSNHPSIQFSPIRITVFSYKMALSSWIRCREIIWIHTILPFTCCFKHLIKHETRSINLMVIDLVKDV